MQIAEQLCKNGVTTSTLFNDKLTELISKRGITKVIETGTHYGEGTTSAIIKGLLGSSKAFDFYSIEVNPEYYKRAKKYLGNITGLHILNGLSVSRSQIPVDTTFNVPDHVIVDHYPQNRMAEYRKEVAFNVPDNLLQQCLDKFNGLPELVVLDSAGHMGWIEFCYLMDRVKGEFLLALDDTSHVKHYETIQYIKARPERFTILWSVDFNITIPANKFGSAIIAVS